jgi:hypothetical protein
MAADSGNTQIPQFGHLRGSQGGEFLFATEETPSGVAEEVVAPHVGGSVRRTGQYPKLISTPGKSVSVWSGALPWVALCGIGWGIGWWIHNSMRNALVEGVQLPGHEIVPLLIAGLITGALGGASTVFAWWRSTRSRSILQGVQVGIALLFATMIGVQAAFRFNTSYDVQEIIGTLIENGGAFAQQISTIAAAILWTGLIGGIGIGAALLVLLRWPRRQAAISVGGWWLAGIFAALSMIILYALSGMHASSSTLSVIGGMALGIVGTGIMLWQAHAVG